MTKDEILMCLFDAKTNENMEKEDKEEIFGNLVKLVDKLSEREYNIIHGEKIGISLEFSFKCSLDDASKLKEKSMLKKAKSAINKKVSSYMK